MYDLDQYPTRLVPGSDILLRRVSRVGSIDDDAERAAVGQAKAYPLPNIAGRISMSLHYGCLIL